MQQVALITIDSTTDFVAATARSGPAPTGSVNSQARGRRHIVYNRNCQGSAFSADAPARDRDSVGLRYDNEHRVSHIDRLSVGCHDRKADVETSKPARVSTNSAEKFLRLPNCHGPKSRRRAGRRGGMRSATLATGSCSARRRSVARDLRISRAMAVCIGHVGCRPTVDN
jgi:hypothetical protein